MTPRTIAENYSERHSLWRSLGPAGERRVGTAGAPGFAPTVGAQTPPALKTLQPAPPSLCSGPSAGQVSVRPPGLIPRTCSTTPGASSRQGTLYLRCLPSPAVCAAGRRRSMPRRLPTAGRTRSMYRSRSSILVARAGMSCRYGCDAARSNGRRPLIAGSSQQPIAFGSRVRRTRECRRGSIGSRVQFVVAAPTEPSLPRLLWAGDSLRLSRRTPQASVRKT